MRSLHMEDESSVRRDDHTQLFGTRGTLTLAHLRRAYPRRMPSSALLNLHGVNLNGFCREAFSRYSYISRLGHLRQDFNTIDVVYEES